MPNILNPNPEGQYGKKQPIALLEAEYEYDYPTDGSLKPGSKLHDDLVSEVMARAADSRRTMSTKYEGWREIDRTLKAYVRPEAKDSKDSDAMPVVVMPIMYATLQTLMTYMSSAFIQEPIFKYDGQGPEDVLGAMLMEKVIHHQTKRSQMGLGIHTMIRDSFAYGFGAVSPRWYEKHGFKTKKVEDGFYSEMTGEFMQTGWKKVREYRMLYEGNELVNIDPYQYLPDPNANISSPQDAEFLGWVERTQLMALMSREEYDESMFNVKYVRHIDGRSSIDISDKPSRGSDAKGENYISTNNPVDVVWMYIDLIPREWKLGSEEFPVTYLLAVAGDQVLINASEVDLNHGMKPVVVAAPDYDGYSVLPASKLGVVNDLQNLMNFLYSSHIANIRKALNDMFVIDPFLANIYDLADSKPGKIIRLRRGAWGRNMLDQAVKQLEVRDVTSGHIQESSYLAEFVQQVTGSTDILQGKMQRRGSRVSATEASGVRNSGLSRLEMTAKIISMQAVNPLAFMLASHTQQFMKEETYVKVTGEWAQRLTQDLGVDPNAIQNDRVKVNPMDLLIHYDVIESDGTIPGSENVEAWGEMFQSIMQNPELSQHFDVPRIFTHIARQMGAKNVDDFVRRGGQVQPQVMEDAEVMNQVDRGNLVPMQ